MCVCVCVCFDKNREAFTLKYIKRETAREKQTDTESAKRIMDRGTMVLLLEMNLANCISQCTNSLETPMSPRLHVISRVY